MCDDRRPDVEADFDRLVARKEAEARAPYAHKIMELEAALAECKRQHAKDVEDAENVIAEMRDDVAGAIESAAEVHTLRVKVIDLQAAIRRIGFIVTEESGKFMRFPVR